MPLVPNHSKNQISKIMAELCLFSPCRNPSDFRNSLVHMSYIYINKIYYINTIKEKTKSDYVGTTHTTSLKPAPPVTNLLYPLCFLMGTTWVQQHTTFLFRPATFALLVLFTVFYDLLFVVCNFFFPEIQKSRNNG